MPTLHLANFRCDVSPPLGHPLCGGWIEPARAIDDPLWAQGVVLLGMGRPVVLCAVDWVGLRNDAHWLWRDALAESAHTVPENVALQCVHPHNAPFADVTAQKLIAKAGAPISLDLKFYDEAVRRTCAALKDSLASARRFTHAGFGKAKVSKVASSRRVLGPNGKVKHVRYSATKNAEAIAAPEGLIDPWLRTLSFWNGEVPLAALSYYATHPMSYYGDGRVTSDFCGLAREQRRAETRVPQIYFNGCAGNITAGKYNNGSHANRPVLRDRMADAMKRAWAGTERFPLGSFEWRSVPVKLPPRTDSIFGEETSRKTLADAKRSPIDRNNSAFHLSYHARRDRAIDFTCLDLGHVQVLHLPGEPFVEFQLFAQEQAGRREVCVAGYGDGGPGYIPTVKAFLEEGYEPTVALARPESEGLVQAAIRKLLQTEK